ncbi:MAG: M20 family peptidase [Candidatus Marinimicrobia bacterium]|nr:M20 family peptidase [Candidatus Neomarinimicrobiota bacterium]
MKHNLTITLSIVITSFFMIACSHTSYQIDVDPVDQTRFDLSSAPATLTEAVKIRTISFSDTSATEASAFDSIHKFIMVSYPNIHASLEREVINTHSLLYTWTGSSRELNPVILLAHTDVVPAGWDSTSTWKVDPFGGIMMDDTVWGRGTLDDKMSVFGILEAVESLLNKGYQPERTIYLAFGHDEEIGGDKGAEYLAGTLVDRHITADLILDEGGIIVEDGVPGITLPVALVGVAEKGYLSLELVAKGVGGHSSMPPKQTAIGVLSQAIVDLQEHPLPSALDGPIREMLVTLAPETGFPFNFLFSNLWAFGGIIKGQLAASPKSNALIRTTTAPTMINAGFKDNALPSEARAVVNFRLKPGESIEAVIQHVEKVIDNPNVSIGIYGKGANPASKVSDHQNDQFKAVAKSIRQTFPGILVSPYISVGGTDAIHYEDVSNNIYRFSPVQLSSERLDGLHGSNERIAVSEYARLINFYIQVIRNSTGPERLW